MQILITILITTISTMLSIYLLYLYTRKSGSKLDYLNASILLQEKKYEEAETLFKKAIDKTSINDSIHLSALMGLYSLYKKMGNNQLSIEILDKAIVLSKKKKEWLQLHKQLDNIKQKHFSQ
jgi:tetratricopeptide (TPR) repeat protein